MSDAWQDATERSLRHELDTDRAEVELLMPKELKAMLGDVDRAITELADARAEFGDFIADLVIDAYQSPYGEPDKPNDLGKRVQSEPAPQWNRVRVANKETADFVNGRLLGITRNYLSKTRELVGLVRDARASCAAELAGVDHRSLPRYRGPKGRHS